MRLLAVTLALALGLAPALARADDLPTPPAAVAVVPGQSVELEQGSPAPFKGNLADVTRRAYELSLREADRAEAKALRLDVQDARARQAAAEAARGPSWGTLIGVAGGALVLGLVGGVALVLAAQK